MSRNRIEDFGAYQDALRLFDLVVQDMDELRNDSRCYRLIGQQVGSADSICANMEEGFGRLSRTEFIRFLDISRGSARETLGRYQRMKHWLRPGTIKERVDLSDRIIAILTRSIQTLRATNNTLNGHSCVREAEMSYKTTEFSQWDIVTESEIEGLLSANHHAPPDTQHPTPDTLPPSPDTRHAPPATRHALIPALALLLAFSVCAQDKPASTGVGTLSRDVSVKEDGDPAVIPEPVVKSIRRAQEYLRKVQNPNGSFYGAGDTGPVSLAILALMVDGSVPGRGPYGREVARGVAYLLNSAQPTGLIHVKGSGTAAMYNHGLSTLCLAEAWGMTRQPEILPVLKRATDLIVRCQNYQGGWRYSPSPSDADTSVTVMQVVALRAAQNSGVYVPQKTIEEAIRYVKGNACKEGGFGYSGPGSPGMARSAAGILSLQMCGEYDAKETRAGLEFLQKHDMAKSEYYFYAQYYAMQAMYQARDSKKWNAWYETQCRAIMSKQDNQGNIGGVWETGMAVLAMGLPYRYLPIYQR